jgi:microcin C transport system permease protein
MYTDQSKPSDKKRDPNRCESVKSVDKKGFRFHWHPVTRRRWARFRGMRRAWWAFWFLLGAYAISLCAEWIANDKPLWVRFEGRNYVPVLRFYPEDAFTGNGRMTRPDYRALAAGEAFAPGSGNWMRWPLIPHGPLESLSPEHIVLPDTVTVTAVPESRVASADLDAGDRIVRTAGDADFFGLAAGAFPPVAGGNAADVGAPVTPGGEARGAEWPEEFRAGLAERRANRAAGPVDARVRLSDGRLVWASLSPFEPRPSPPSHVRVTFREELKAPERITAVVAATDPVYPDGFPAPGTPGWRFTISREQVNYPFRPVKGHPLGLDSSGRDVAARMLYALRTSLTFGMALVLATMALGTLAGAVQGYYGGTVDLLGQRFIEIWESLPFIYVLILLGRCSGRVFFCCGGVCGVQLDRHFLLHARGIPSAAQTAVCGSGAGHRPADPENPVPPHAAQRAGAAGDLFPVFAGGGDRHDGGPGLSGVRSAASHPELGRTAGAGAGVSARLVAGVYPSLRCFHDAGRRVRGEGLRAATIRGSSGGWNRATAPRQGDGLSVGQAPPIRPG